MGLEVELRTIREQIVELFPEAVKVSIFVTADRIEANVDYVTDLRGTAMVNLSGAWVKKQLE